MIRYDDFVSRLQWHLRHHLKMLLQILIGSRFFGFFRFLKSIQFLLIKFVIRRGQLWHHLFILSQSGLRLLIKVIINMGSMILMPFFRNFYWQTLDIFGNNLLFFDRLSTMIACLRLWSIHNLSIIPHQYRVCSTSMWSNITSIMNIIISTIRLNLSRIPFF
jgi:hypothetical protein